MKTICPTLAQPSFPSRRLTCDMESVAAGMLQQADRIHACRLRLMPGVRARKKPAPSTAIDSSKSPTTLSFPKAAATSWRRGPPPRSSMADLAC